MRQLIIVVAPLCLAVGCGSSSRSSRKSGVSTRQLRGGCGATRLYRGTPPSWTADAFSDSSPFASVPFALAANRTAAAVVFGYPLRSGTPTGRLNKVLWIMRRSRHGSPLTIHATPLHASAPVITVTEPADSGPGQIYPSYVNVPTAGCWHLTLRWASHVDAIDLRYTRAANEPAS